MLDLIHGECFNRVSPQGPWGRWASGFCSILVPVAAAWAWHAGALCLLLLGQSLRIIRSLEI